MPRAFGEGGTVLMAGRRYDLGKIIGAAERVIDLLALRLDGGRAFLTTDRPEYRKKVRWPDPGKGIAREFWLEASRLYDGVDEPLVVGTGAIIVRWYALGRAYVLYDGGRDAILDHGRDVIDFLDPQPCLVIHGEPNATLIATVDWAVRALCEDLGLGLWTADPVHAPSGLRVEGHVALLRFPHDRYGDGEGPVRIRCVPA